MKSGIERFGVLLGNSTVFGIKLSVNSDDPGVFGIYLSHEYELLQNKFNFSIADFNFHNRLALEHSFIPESKKIKLYEVFL